MDTPAVSAVAVIWAVGSAAVIWAVGSATVMWAVGSAPAVIWAAACGGHFGGSSGARGRSGASQHFAGPRGHLDHGRRLGRGFGFGPGWYDYGCSYDYTYYDPYRCYLPEN